MKTFVIPDAHGNHVLVRGLLEQEGITEGGKRVVGSEVRVIQLGDLANCVLGSWNDDMEALSLVGPVIDFMLVGNHEHPYFGGPAFFGFHHWTEVGQALSRLERYELIWAAYEVDDILLTHAGVSEDAREVTNDAAEWARALNTLWREDPTHAMFSAVGPKRGGFNPHGGVLWADWSEPKTPKLKQIVGHTVDESWRAYMPPNGDMSTFGLTIGDSPRYAVNRLCLDVGAGKDSTRILGCWIEDGEVEIVEHSTT